MSDEVKLEVIKKTQDLLGKYFKRPPLTEKLLKKPPFRFIHDIISAVIKETGFLEGLFTEEELNSDNVKDKESKVAYLTKLIEVVKLATGSNLSARPSKIVAGQEPTKTNELLQAIGKALDKKISSKEAIAKYRQKSEEKTGKKSKPSDKDKSGKSSTKNSTKKSESKEKLSKTSSKDESVTPKEENHEENTAVPKDNKIDGKADKTASNEIPEKPRTDEFKLERQSTAVRRERKSSAANEKPPKTANLSRQKSAVFDATNSSSQKDKEDRAKKESASTKRRKSIKVDDVNHFTSNVSETIANDGEKTTINGETVDVRREEPVANGAVSSNDVDAANKQAAVESIRPRTSLRPPSGRPASARPAAPRLRSKTDFVINEETFAQTGGVNIIVENFDTKEDDAEDMIVMEASRETLQATEMDKMDGELLQEHGHLVAQILETQKELTNSQSVDIFPKKVEIEWEAGSRRGREVVVKEIDRLRGTIQTLTRATNPLGKLLDFVQEDVEIMQKELREWQRQNEELSQELELEKKRTSQSIEPMRTSLEDITNNIKHQLVKINQLKFNIMKNDQKLQRLLSGNL